jgi:SNF2 family DNA or RNA helicase
VFSPVEGGGKGLKAVVFSQWTHMLDLVAKVLTHKNWGYGHITRDSFESIGNVPVAISPIIQV